MFGQVPPTQFDLNFTLFGVPVRVHPVFWLTSGFLAWRDQRLDLTVVGILCIFVAILVHELGHALMNARFGWRSEIVLYFFGGYATSMRHSTWRDVAVSAAGPAAGFLLFAAVLFGTPWLVAGLRSVGPGSFDTDSRAVELIGYAGRFSLFINLAWNVMNLLPVLPLDGGQISRALFERYGGRNGLTNCVRLSLVAAAGVALWALWARTLQTSVLGLEPLFLALMFGYLAFQNWQTLQDPDNRGGW
ncbi:MAG: site-2 protease family protein [Planctomycetales bacterium]